MKKCDVIINVFNCSSMSPCLKWSEELFEEPPLVVVVPAGQFRQKAIQWGRTGDLFKAAVKEMLHQDIEVRRRGLVTFSAGWVFADELFKFDNEVFRLDAYILLDGCHVQMLNNWIKFAVRAVSGKAFMVMAHSSITPPYISAYKSNSLIFNKALKMVNTHEDIVVPQYILQPELPQYGITISVGAVQYLPSKTKVWKKDCLFDYRIAGKLVRLHYDGNDRPDHIYIAWYVSKRLWKWFGELWTKEQIKDNLESKSKQSLQPLETPPTPTNPNKEEPPQSTNKEKLPPKSEPKIPNVKPIAPKVDSHTQKKDELKQNTEQNTDLNKQQNKFQLFLLFIISFFRKLFNLK